MSTKTDRIASLIADCDAARAALSAHDQAVADAQAAVHAALADLGRVSASGADASAERQRLRGAREHVEELDAARQFIVRRVDSANVALADGQSQERRAHLASIRGDVTREATTIEQALTTIRDAAARMNARGHEAAAIGSQMRFDKFVDFRTNETLARFISDRLYALDQKRFRHEGMGSSLSEYLDGPYRDGGIV